MPDVEVRAFTHADLPAAVRIHLAAFPSSALGDLGPEALRRYYAWLLDGPHDTTALVAMRAGEAAGFVFGGVFRGALSGFLARHRAYLAWRVLTHPRLLASPIVRDRVATAVKLLARRAPSSPQPSRPAAPPAFGILAIAVDPGAQGGGVGQALMHAAEAAARAHAFTRMQLTVAPDNAQAIRFYERGGWIRAATTGAWTGSMTKSLQ